MYDLHTHILPGIDDGANEIGDSYEMLRIAAENGTKAIVCTPHISFSDADSESVLIQIRTHLQQLRDYIHSSDLPLQVLIGQEILLTESSIPALRKGKCIPLNITLVSVCAK